MISVIVPVYNVEKYLAECVDSILAQTYQDLEVLLIDDGSTDRSGAICDEYAQQDARVRVIHKENGGLASARNVGFAAFQGDYLACIDSDDSIDLRTFEIQLKAMEADCSDMVISGIRRYCRDKTLDVVSPPKRVVNVKEATELFLRLTGYMTSVCNKLYRGSVLRGFQATPFRCAEDIVTTPYAIQRCKTISLIPDVLYHYRMRTGSITTDHYSPEKLVSIQSYDEASEAIRDWYPDLEDLICSFLGRSALWQLSHAINAKPRLCEAEASLAKRVLQNASSFQVVGSIPRAVWLEYGALKLGLPFYRFTLNLFRLIRGKRVE